MKSKILSAIILGASLSFSSCSDYLDISPTDKVSDKLTWSKVEYAELAVNNFYQYINYLGNFNNGQSIAGMTEGFTDIFKYGAMTYNAHMYIPNELAYGGTVLTPSYVATYLGNWSGMYERLRFVNQGLSDLKKWGGSIAEPDRLRLEAEMKFFRGMLYFDLVKRYKSVILYDEDMSKIKKNTPLSSESEGWDMVEKDLDFAAKNLPVSTKAVGRITSGAAYGLLSRAMLYAERWSVAKSAAQEVMKMGYKLEDNYATAFTSGNREAILQYSFEVTGMTHGFDNYFTPGGDKNNNMTGGYGTPTQEMVESYELASGGFADWSKWYTGEGVTETPPYANLEPRFQASILYNGASWKGRIIEPFIGGVDGWAAWKDDAVPAGRTTTGYYLRKLVDEKHKFEETQSSTQPWISIRYAEIWLNYAEACYHTNDPVNANLAVKEIRSRVELPYTNKSGSDLLKAIRQERKVELAYEGQYYWDMKRWKLAHTAFTGNRVHGFKIENNGDGTFIYTYVDCDKQDRSFPEKMYQIPLPADELNGNSAIQQYTEWR